MPRVSPRQPCIFAAVRPEGLPCPQKWPAAGVGLAGRQARLWQASSRPSRLSAAPRVCWSSPAVWLRRAFAPVGTLPLSAREWEHWLQQPAVFPAPPSADARSRAPYQCFSGLPAARQQLQVAPRLAEAGPLVEASIAL